MIEGEIEEDVEEEIAKERKKERKDKMTTSCRCVPRNEHITTHATSAPGNDTRESSHARVAAVNTGQVDPQDGCATDRRAGAGQLRPAWNTQPTIASTMSANDLEKV